MIWEITKYVSLTLGILAAGLGGFLAGYLKKKGENRATHEDLDKLVKQVEATTNATKAIEARISDELWNRQRHWEMKRDSLFAALQALGRVDDALAGVAVVAEAERKTVKPENLSALKAEAKAAWHQAISDFAEKRVMALVVCGKKTNAALLDAGQQSKDCAKKLFAGQGSSYEECALTLGPAIARVFATIRRDLAVESPESTSDSFRE
jgi:hypothetical protein